MANKKEPENIKAKQLSRRDFLKAGGAVLASAVLFNSLAACASTTTTTATATATKTATATATQTTTATATTTATQTATATATTTKTTTTTTIAAPPKDLVIGATLALTGAFSADNITTWQGIQTCAEWINNKGGLNISGQIYMIKAAAEDSQMTPDGGIAAVNKLVFSDNAKFVIGGDIPFISDSESKITEANKVFFMLTSSLNKGDLKPLTFASFPLDGAIEPCYNYLAKTYPTVKTIVLIVPEDPSLAGFQATTKANAQRLGMNVVDIESFTAGTTDFYPIWTKILPTKPDAVDVGLGMSDWMGAILKQGRELGFKGPIFYTSPSADPVVIRDMATAANATDFFMGSPYLQAPDILQMVKDINSMVLAKFNVKATQSHLSGFDAVWYITQIITSAQSVDPVAVGKAFENMSSIQTPYGQGAIGGLQTYGFKHLVIPPMGISTISNGQISNVGFSVPNIP